MPALRRLTNSFTSTSSEIKAHKDFYVGPGSQQNPHRKEVTFLVLRINDERSSDLCKRMEQMAFSNGGLDIKDEDAIKRGFSSEYRTRLFHDNCRCRLIIKPSALGDQADYIDFQMAAGKTAISSAALSRAKKELSEDLIDDYSSESYQQRIRHVMDINLETRNKMAVTIQQEK